MLFHNQLFKYQCAMKYFFEAILFAHFVAALANSSVKPMENNNNMKKAAQSDMINNYYAGPSCKKIEQQLAEIKRDMAALKENLTGNSSAGFGLLASEVKQQLAEIKQGIKQLKTNQTGCSAAKVPKNCAEVYKAGDRISGVYKIDPDGLGEFEVFCDQKTAGGGWIVFQKRQDGSVDFFRGWNDYKQGFGNLNGEFWLGLEKIHRLIVSSSNKLRVDTEDIHGKTQFAEYSSFAVSDEKTNYQLSLGSYSGTARDALIKHRGMSFSTWDHDRDANSSFNCARSYKSGWWYWTCHSAHLNGPYRPGKPGPGVNRWYSKGLKRSEMKIRPKNF